MFTTNQSRRRFLESSLGLGAAVLVLGCSSGSENASGGPLGIDGSGRFLDTGEMDPFAGGKFLGALRFENVTETMPGKKAGTGLDGRMILDLPSLLLPETRITPSDL